MLLSSYVLELHAINGVYGVWYPDDIEIDAFFSLLPTPHTLYQFPNFNFSNVIFSSFYRTQKLFAQNFRNFVEAFANSECKQF